MTGSEFQAFDFAAWLWSLWPLGLVVFGLLLALVERALRR